MHLTYHILIFTFDFLFDISDEANEPVRKQQSSKTLRHQTQDLSKLQPSTVATILKKCIIYNQGITVVVQFFPKIFRMVEGQY